MTAQPQKMRSQDAVAFLPAALEALETPPSKSGRVLAFVIAAFFLLLVIWAYVGTIDIVVVGQGQTIPTGRAKLVQPLEVGVVRAIHVEDGDLVEAGQLLIEMDPTETAANVENLQAQLLKARIDADINRSLLSEDPKSLRLSADLPPHLEENTRRLALNLYARHSAELASIDAELGGQNATLATAAIETSRIEETRPLLIERLEAQESLLERGITEKPLVLELRQRLVEINHAEQTAAQTQLQAEAAIQLLEARRSETIARFVAEAAERRQTALTEIASLEQELSKAQRRQNDRELRAPVRGYVDRLAVHTLGRVLETGAQALWIIPSDAPLEIDAKILNKDIGFIEVGDPVEIKLEAFPFTRYGTLIGEITSISTDAILDETLGPIYRAKSSLDSQTIAIEGKDIPLAPGMNASVEIKTGHRRIIDYFLSPLLRYQDEAIRER